MRLKAMYAIGFSLWKRSHLRAFLYDKEICFVKKPSCLPQMMKIEVAVWGMHWDKGDLPMMANVLRLEDGFIRSVGLGADLIRPLSWVCDDLGIYYNARSPSRLEVILNESSFSEATLERAERLRNRLTTLGVTKYNVGTGNWKRGGLSKKVILVPGQVESDASIAYGASQVRTNIGLLQAVRRANPNAFIIYKPHPDVVAGLRKTGEGEWRSNKYCDLQLIDVPMSQLLEEIDEVHTMTSLTGFEALLRKKSVVTYGMPFYAGWGITTDLGMLPDIAARRKRRLLLNELIAGALISYPIYVSRKTGKPSTPEIALDELSEWHAESRSRFSIRQFVLRRILSLRKY